MITLLWHLMNSFGKNKINQNFYYTTHVPIRRFEQSGTGRLGLTADCVRRSGDHSNVARAPHGANQVTHTGYAGLRVGEFAKFPLLYDVVYI